ncbi:hypothetical protein M3O96_20455 [Aquiflexum sp. TKW24L]|uniref:hypothetical protein n=1 Tax=Aquiflexum sp. TKW24L TaxID=2942212 RepID=UPI0020BF7826|nr:hypothetical protein [Aquiflexum sp. TKW24L]MCL6261483.1 hypothetical protein [Aquiflexum sp. TKW24L]
MKINRLLSLLILLTALGTSCKTYKNLEKVKPKTESASMAEQLQKLKPGDRIKVYVKNGDFMNLEFSSFDEREIKGIHIKEFARIPISIMIEDIYQVKVKKTNWPVTIISIPAGLFATWLIVGTIAFSSY